MSSGITIAGVLLGFLIGIVIMPRGAIVSQTDQMVNLGVAVICALVFGIGFRFVYRRFKK